MLGASPSTTTLQICRSSLTFIGTAIVLVEIGSFTFLTDPNFLQLATTRRWATACGAGV